MKRALALGGLTALLMSCSPAPVKLNDMTVDLGQATSTTVTQSFGGTWRVTGVPLWLSVNRETGSGAVALTVTADRNAVTPLQADRPTLTDTFKVEWTAADGQTSGTALVKVSAAQYTLSGRVQEQASVSAADTLGTPALNSGAAGESNGIIVTYRSGTLRDAVLSSDGLQAQSAPASSAGRSAATLQELGVTRPQKRALTGQSLVLSVPATRQALDTLRRDPNVERAVPNRVLHVLSTGTGQAPMTGQTLAAPLLPTDQYAPLQWAFTLMGYRAVWRDMEAGKYTRPVTVAVLDSGVRFEHPDLAGKLYGPKEGALDFVDGDTDPTDPGAPDSLGDRATHGTHVTGIIAANWGQNAAPICAGCSPTGVVGASYRAPVKVLPLRVLGSQGTDVATLTTALQYAAGQAVPFPAPTAQNPKPPQVTNPHPAQVINLSLGGPDLTSEEAAPMCEAIAAARERGVLTFAAAGNDSSATPYYPAACPAAVAVGSVTLSGGSAPVKAWYSNHYPKVELSAPGGASLGASHLNGGTLNGQPFPDDIFSTAWNYQKNEPSYQAMAGTSQATPQASALAALLLSKGVTTGAEATLARMKSTATDLGAAGSDDLFGAGMLNAAAALNAPAVSDMLGLRLQDAQGRTFQPALNTLGQFTAYVGDGIYQVIGGRDHDGNGIYGEVQEPRASKQVTLGSSLPAVNVGSLVPQ
ncbi:S8 family serine peptidase [Deinococcus fonticola]|uniref:S8 family serine peptidase n=1 Tax=Deinococcus fonticola TaxID=2528713 RepID=UPI001074A514|nr:S8 family serine peptidase [Deinococcus fonticola]